MSIEINLTGKTALVTGGTRGIGKAIVDKFLEAGANVIATGTKVEQVEKLNEINKDSAVQYYHLDLTDSTNLAEFFKNTKDKDFDILINNAGININNPANNILEEDFDKLHMVNLKNPFLLCKKFGKKMTNKKWGRIINIASIWSVVTRNGRLSYSTSKMGLLGMSKTLAVEWSNKGVLVNCVSPGFTLTELTKSTNTQQDLKIIEEQIPIGRLAIPSEIANTVLFLSSNLNTYITGQNIIVDGGYTII